MKRGLVSSIIINLIFLCGNLIPAQAQKNTANKPDPNLVNAIIQTIRTEFKDFDWNEIKKDITYKYTEVDLDKDGIKETLVSIQEGFPCNNRHCPVYIYQKKGKNYRFISYIFTSRGELEVALLPNINKGWFNIAALVFTYEPREIAWRVFKFDGSKYVITSQKLNSTPKQIILRDTSGSLFNFVNQKR